MAPGIPPKTSDGLDGRCEGDEVAKRSRKKGAYLKRHKSPKRTQRIELRVTPEEGEAIRAKATELELSVADAVRRAALELEVIKPPSVENLSQWRELGHLGFKLHRSVDLLTRVVEQLEGDGDGSVDPRVAQALGEPGELRDLAAQIEAQVQELGPVLRELREVLRGAVAAGPRGGE